MFASGNGANKIHGNMAVPIFNFNVRRDPSAMPKDTETADQSSWNDRGLTASRIWSTTVMCDDVHSAPFENE